VAKLVRFVLMDAGRGAWPRPIRFAATVVMFELAVFVAAYLVYWIARRPVDRDFGSQYAAASVGLHSGWSQIYDPGELKRFEQAFGAQFSIYLHPPPVAWLAVPLTALPFPLAALLWQGILLVALGACVVLIAPRGSAGRVLMILSIAGFQPTLFALGYATMSPLILLLLVGAVIAMRSGHQVIAGILLGITVLKPQLTLLILPLLLLSGYWKPVVTASAVALALAGLSVAVVGTDGARAYLSLLTSPGELNHAFPWTVKGLVGAGAPSLIATGLVVVALLGIAITLRPAPDLALGLGVLASLFVAQHLNYGDFLLWLLPIWLAFEAGRPRWLGATAGVTWLCGWFVVGIPQVALAGEIGLAIALVAAIVAARPQRAKAVATTTVSAQAAPNTS